MYIPPEKDRWRIATPMETIWFIMAPAMNRCYLFLGVAAASHLPICFLTTGGIGWPHWLSQGSWASFHCLYFEDPDRTKSLNGRDRKAQWVKTSVGFRAVCWVFFLGGWQKNSGKKIGEKRKKHLGVLCFVLGVTLCFEMNIWMNKIYAMLCWYTSVYHK